MELATRIKIEIINRGTYKWNKLTLNNQVTIPLTGLGVYQINNLDECEHTVLNALKMGYRLMNTAACYGNEKAVGNAIKKSQIHS